MRFFKEKNTNGNSPNGRGSAGVGTIPEANVNVARGAATHSPRPTVPAQSTAAAASNLQSSSAFTGKTIRQRGEARYSNFIWQIVAVVFLALMLIFKFQDHQTIKALTEKEGIVFEVNSKGETQVKDASEYHSAPLDVEIKARALDVTKWIIGAGSNNVETYYPEAQNIMTTGMRKDFEQLRGSDHVQKLKELQIYRLIDRVQARPAKTEDLPADLQRVAQLDRYYVTVSGYVNTYRMNSNQQLDGAPFAMLVKLVPAESRTEQNPSGLLVEHIRDLDAVQVLKNNQPGKSSEEEKKDNTQGTNSRTELENQAAKESK